MSFKAFFKGLYKPKLWVSGAIYHVLILFQYAVYFEIETAFVRATILLLFAVSVPWMWGKARKEYKAKDTACVISAFCSVMAAVIPLFFFAWNVQMVYSRTITQSGHVPEKFLQQQAMFSRLAERARQEQLMKNRIEQEEIAPAVKP